MKSMKRLDLAVASLLLAGWSAIALAPSVAFAKLDGAQITGRSDGCSPCHGGSSDSVEVTLVGPTLLGPGDSATYTAAITALDTKGAGLDAALVGDASLANLETNTQLSSGEIVHLDASSSALAGNIGQWSYDFQVVIDPLAMIGSSVDIMLAMLAFNGDFTAGGDLWNTLLDDQQMPRVFTISIVPEPSTSILLGMVLAGFVIVRIRRRRAPRAS